MAETIKMNITGSSDKALAELRKIVAGQEEVIQSLKRGSQVSKKAGDDTVNTFTRAKTAVISMVSSYVGISAAIGGVKRAYSAWLEDVQKSVQASTELVNNYRTLAIMKGQDWPGFKGEVFKAAGPYAATPAQATRATETIVSLMPKAFGFSPAQQTASLKSALAFSEAYSVEPATAATMIGKAGGMLSKYNISPRQWTNALAGTIERGGYAGSQIQEWAGAMPTAFGAALSAEVPPAQLLAFAQVMSQVTGTPAEGMGGAEQILRLITGTKATKAIPELAGMGTMDRLDFLAGRWQTEGAMKMRPDLEKAIGARGLRYLPRALAKWDLYAPALAATRSDLESESDMVDESLGHFRQMDPAGKLVSLTARGKNAATLARLTDIEAMRTEAGWAWGEAMSLQSGQSAVGRGLSKGIYHINRFLGHDPTTALGDAFGMHHDMALTPKQRMWNETLRPAMESALSVEAITEKLEAIRAENARTNALLERGQQDVTPEEAPQ